MQKPDGLTIITEGDVIGRIRPLPVRKLWGVGPKTEACLCSMGIKTIGQLAELSQEELIERFGKSHGEHLYNASKGIDESPLITHWEPKSTGREITFQRDIDNHQTVADLLKELVEEVVIGMKESGYKGSSVTVKIKFSDFQTQTRAKTIKETTDSVDIIKEAALGCLRRFEFKKKVRLIGVRIGGLEK